MFRHVFNCGNGRCIALAAGAVHSFTARRGERIVCRGGYVLLTQFNVAEDFELHSGSEIIVQKHGLVVLEAAEASVLEVSVAGQKYLQQTVQVTLPTQSRTHMLGRYLQQLFALRRQ